MNKLLISKIKEALQSILPLTAVVIVVLIGLRVDTKDILMFSFGALLLIVGLVIFGIGASQSMMYLSKEIGSYITRKRKLAFFIIVGFLIGFMITISEPSVWVLGEQFQSTVPKLTLVLAISIGSAFFIIIALLRLIFKIPLNIIIIIIFSTLFLLAYFMPSEFVPVAFDAGGFSTGPMAVPFLVSLGFGVISSTSNAKSEDNFGTLGITSIGPIFAVLLLGLFFNPQYTQTTSDSKNFFGYILQYMGEIGIAITPFIIFFIVFQLFAFKFPKKRVIRIFIGFLLTYFGLVIFLSGAAIGFMNIGSYLGGVIASFDQTWLLIPFGLLFGLVIVLAEPSVVVLVNQVQEATDGSISKKIMLPTLSIGVGLAIALSMTRIVFDISIWWFLLPGYLIVIILSFFVPKLFTAISMDSGGAVSGALASTFLVPFALGAAEVIYAGNESSILKNAFGLMALVVMAPLITIQLLGLIYKLKYRAKPVSEATDEIIKLEEN